MHHPFTPLPAANGIQIAAAVGVVGALLPAQRLRSPVLHPPPALPAANGGQIAAAVGVAGTRLPAQ
eukprot:365338-Chlamydomonas_euryale.AAC.21